MGLEAGVDSTSMLRIRGEGDVGPQGGAYGDVYVTFRVNLEPNFWREGLDLFSEVQSGLASFASSSPEYLS